MWPFAGALDLEVLPKGSLEFMISESALARGGFRARSISYLPAFAATELRIPEDAFVLTSHQLDSGFIIRSATDDTAGAIAVSIETIRKSLSRCVEDSHFLRTFTRVNSCPRSGCDALGMPNVQRTSCKGGGYVYSRKYNSAWICRTVRASSFPLLSRVVHYRLEVVPVGKGRSLPWWLHLIGRKPS